MWWAVEHHGRGPEPVSEEEAQHLVRGGARVRARDRAGARLRAREEAARHRLGLATERLAVGA